MLDTMRGLSKSYVAKALMILLVLSFAMWGVGDMLRSRGNSYLLKVGDETVSPQQFANEQRSMQRAMEQMGIRGIDAKALQSEILRRMVQQRLVNQWRKDSGLAVNRDMLAKNVAEAVEYKDVHGKFDPKLFAATLQNRQMNETIYLAQLGEELGSKAMVSGIESADMQAPASLLALNNAAGTQTRDAVVITVPAANVAAPTEEEVNAYYEEHASDFQQPEARTLEYVIIDRASLNKLAPNDATPEAREQAAQEMSMQVEDALAGGSSMGEALAQAHVAATSKILNKVTPEQFASSTDALLRGVAQHGFQMGEGESSGLTSTADGRYYMVSVKSINAAQPKPLAEVSAQVRNELVKDKTRTATRDKVADLKKALAAGTDWQKAVADAKANGRAVANIERPIVAPDGKISAANPAVPPLVQQALFEHEVGSVAGPMVRENGEQVIALVTAIHTKAKAATTASSAAAAKEYTTQLGNDVQAGLFRALAKRYPVNVNEAMLQQLNGSNE